MSQTKAQLIAPVGSGLTLDGNLTATDVFVSTDYPSVRPAIDFPFALTRELDSRITYTRNSTATFIDKTGFLKTAPAMSPRFDHHPTTGESLGFLVEESRTNLRTYSEDLTAWGNKIGCTIVSNTTTAPDGNLTADSMLETTSTATWRWTEWGQTCTSGTSYTVSAFLKAGTGTHGTIFFFGDNAVFSHGTVVFSLSGNGSVTSLPASTTATITPYGNGWYRVSATQTATASSTGYFAIGFSYSPLNNVSITGSASNTLGNVWGIQSEAGAFPTSYIPTSASTATRVADVTSISSSNLSWYKPQEGTWIIDVNKTFGLSNTYAALFYIYPITPNRHELWKFNTSSKLRYNYYDDSGTSQVGITSSNDLVSGRNKIYAAYKTNDCTLGINGTNSGTDTVATMQTSLSSSTYIGLFSVPIGGGEFWNGHICRFTYYPVKLNSTQLTNLTS